MTKLTEEMIIAKTKQSNLGAIKKMNCWGSELVDVSLLRRLNNIEVLSLSVNKIASLSDFQYCRNLQELFVRKNNIRELNQVCYLQHLPKLVNLWLDENPCTECDGYRLTVIRALPNLKKLDNVPVDPEELEEALQKGRELVHPEEETMVSPDREEENASDDNEDFSDDQPVQSRRNSRPMAPTSTTTSQDMEPDYYEAEQSNSHSPEPTMYSSPPPQYSVYQRQYEPVTSPVKAETEPSNNFPDRRLEKLDESNVSSSLALDPQMSLKDEAGWGAAQGESSGSDHSSPTTIMGGVPRSRTNEEELNAARAAAYQHQSQSYHQHLHDHHLHHAHLHDHHQQQQHDHATPSYERPRTAERAAREARAMEHRCNRAHQPPYHRRPTTRNSNILSAVLCLVKELDYPSLEVVEMAIRCRMDELED